MGHCSSTTERDGIFREPGGLVVVAEDEEEVELELEDEELELELDELVLLELDEKLDEAEDEDEEELEDDEAEELLGVVVVDLRERRSAAEPEKDRGASRRLTKSWSRRSSVEALSLGSMLSGRARCCWPWTSRRPRMLSSRSKSSCW